MAKITCDHCGAEMDFAPLYYREGDLEITCMRCGNCTKEYVSAVTDSALREDIERYKRMAKMMADRKIPIVLNALFILFIIDGCLLV